MMPAFQGLSYFDDFLKVSFACAPPALAEPRRKATPSPLAGRNRVQNDDEKIGMQAFDVSVNYD